MSTVLTQNARARRNVIGDIWTRISENKHLCKSTRSRIAIVSHVIRNTTDNVRLDSPMADGNFVSDETMRGHRSHRTFMPRWTTAYTRANITLSRRYLLSIVKSREIPHRNRTRREPDGFCFIPLCRIRDAEHAAKSFRSFSVFFVLFISFFVLLSFFNIFSFSFVVAPGEHSRACGVIRE